MNGHEKDDLVVVARFVKPKGLKGEVVADILTDFPERFENLESAFLKGTEVSSVDIEYFRFEKNRVVFKLSNVDSIEDAESLRGRDLCVSEDDAVELDEDEYFDWQLVGCEVKDTQGNVIGDVIEIFRAGENLNLVVKSSSKEVMIPFVKAICLEVDVDSKNILADPPEGLLEF